MEWSRRAFIQVWLYRKGDRKRNSWRGIRSCWRWYSFPPPFLLLLFISQRERILRCLNLLEGDSLRKEEGIMSCTLGVAGQRRYRPWGACGRILIRWEERLAFHRMQMRHQDKGSCEVQVWPWTTDETAELAKQTGPGVMPRDRGDDTPWMSRTTRLRRCLIFSGSTRNRGKDSKSRDFFSAQRSWPTKSVSHSERLYLTKIHCTSIMNQAIVFKPAKWLYLWSLHFGGLCFTTRFILV